MAKRFRDLPFKLSSGYKIVYRNKGGQFARPHSRSRLSVEVYKGPRRLSHSDFKKWIPADRDNELLKALPVGAARLPEREIVKSYKKVQTVWAVSPEFQGLAGQTVGVKLSFQDEEGRTFNRQFRYHVGLPVGRQDFQTINQIGMHNQILSMVESLGFRVSPKAFFRKDDRGRRRVRLQRVHNLKVELWK